MDAERRRANKALDALLRQAPDLMLRILEEGDLSPILEQLRQTAAPGPEWVRAKAGTLRLKCGFARLRLLELARELEAARSDWEAAGGSDPLRADQAELLLKQIAEKTEELSALRERMTDMIRFADRAEEGAGQAELMAALTQLRRFGKEAAE